MPSNYDIYLDFAGHHIYIMASYDHDLPALLSRLRATFQGVSFRLFEDALDYRQMARASIRSCEADGFMYVATPEELAARDRLNEPVDPRVHRLVITSGGTIVGFTSIHVMKIAQGPKIYAHSASLDGDWRFAGLRKAMLKWNEAVAGQISSSSGDSGEVMFESCAHNADNEWKAILESEGYMPASHVLEMVRPNLEDVPDLPLPQGVEVRQVVPEHYRAIWSMAKEANRDHRDFLEEYYTEERYQEWLRRPDFQPHLWQVAWAADEVVGAVRSYILEDENREFDRLRGHTEHIHVAREWRRKGVASALLARSLSVLRDHGMKEATLDVDAENLSGALRVYERLGFEERYHFIFYRKPLDA